MNKIVLNNICKYYIDKKQKSAIAALFNVNLEIEMQKTSVVLGPSGCGKTTLLKSIAGLIDLDEGFISMDGKNAIEQRLLRNNMSYVSQGGRLYPHMTVFDNIAFPLKNQNIPIEELKIRVIDLAKILKIDYLLTRKPKQLSGGQQQKVSIARALVKLPQILLLDEPFANLDSENRAQLKSLLIELKSSLSLTIIMVTHQIEDSYGLADVVVYMDNGEIVSLERRANYDAK